MSDGTSSHVPVQAMIIIYTSIELIMFLLILNVLIINTLV